MKIKFLGTSAGWPLPRLGCADKICSSNDPKDIRTRSQALVDDILLLDLGPDTYQHLNNPKIDPLKIKYAAITHEHLDHTLGLWDLSHIYTPSGRSKIKVVINPNTLAKIRFMFYPKEYEIIKLKEGYNFQADSLRVSLLPVNHTKGSSYGVLVESTNKRFFWAPDFKSLPAETKKIIYKIDFICMDGSELKVKTPSHQTVEEGIRLAKEIKAKVVYFIHIGHRTLPYKELEKFLQKKAGKYFHAAFDGLEKGF